MAKTVSISENEIVWAVSDFVAVFNQTIEYAYPSVVIVGELANFRISKNRWVYFDLKDDLSSVRFFGTVYGLPGPLEDGMLLQVRGMPRLHPQFGFNVTFDAIQPVGEGTIKRASNLLEEKLRKEGIFDDIRKRALPYPPQKIGLIASGESAGYSDFIKILNQRWGGVQIELIDVQVQGESAPRQIVSAIEQMNSETEVEVIVITRGGGSPEDLAAFSHESVVRAVAASRIPTLVAVGHEIDTSLAELAADKRASTPSNAAETLVPDKVQELRHMKQYEDQLRQYVLQTLAYASDWVQSSANRIFEYALASHSQATHELKQQLSILELLNPKTILKRGYVLVRNEKNLYIDSVTNLKASQKIKLQFHDGTASAKIEGIDIQ